MPKKEVVANKKPVDEKPRETTVEFLASLAAVLVTGLFIITFVLQAFEIPSSSMEDSRRRHAGWGLCCRIAIFTAAT